MNYYDFFCISRPTGLRGQVADTGVEACTCFCNISCICRGMSTGVLVTSYSLLGMLSGFLISKEIGKEVVGVLALESTETCVNKIIPLRTIHNSWQGWSTLQKNS